MSDTDHPIQTDAPYNLDGDTERVEAALEELEHYIWRADTPPGKSTLDPNLNRCKNHLEVLKRSLHTGTDQSENANVPDAEER